MKKLVLILAAALASGCCSVTEADVIALHNQIRLERKASVARKGFEKTLEDSRATVDDNLDAMKKAHR